jgi:hypothetical protein
MEQLDVAEAVSKRLVKQLRVEHKALYQLQEKLDQQNKACHVDSARRLTQSEDTQNRLEDQHRTLQHKVESLETMFQDMRKDIQAVRSEEMRFCQEMRTKLGEIEKTIAKNYSDCMAYLESAGVPRAELHDEREPGGDIPPQKAIDGKYWSGNHSRVSTLTTVASESVLVAPGNTAIERVSTPAVSPITTAYTSISPSTDRTQSATINVHAIELLQSPFTAHNQQDRLHTSSADIQPLIESISQTNSWSSEYGEDDDLDALMRIPKTVWASKEKESASKPRSIFTTTKVAQPVTRKDKEAITSQNLQPLQASNISHKRLGTTNVVQGNPTNPGQSNSRAFQHQPHQKGQSDKGRGNDHELDRSAHHYGQNMRARVLTGAPAIDSSSGIATSTKFELSRKRTLPQQDRNIRGVVNKKRNNDASYVPFNDPHHVQSSGDVKKGSQTSTMQRKMHTNNPVTIPSELPRLRQGKKKFSNYYKEAIVAFSRYNDKSDEGHQRFVNHFLSGISLVRVRKVATEKLQQLQESTFRDDKVWIICHWEDVIDALLAAELLTMDEVN